MKLHHRQFVALGLFCIVWALLLSTAYGMEAAPTVKGTIAENYGTDVLKASVWIIGGLLGLVQVLVGYIYVSGMRHIKTSIDDLKNSNNHAHVRIDGVEKEKLDKADHDRICTGVKKSD